MNLFKIFNIISKESRNLINDFEKIINIKLNRFKKKIFFFSFELLFIVLSIIFLILGSILFLSRFLPIDLIIIIYGFLLLYIAFIIKLLSPR